MLLIGMAGMFLLASAVVLFYVRNQKRLQRQKEEQIRYQKELTYAVIQSQEAERKRIGRDLHDDVGSALSNLKLYTIQLQEGRPEAFATYKAFRTQVDVIIDKVRSISHMLSPAELEMFGLEESIEELCLVIHQSGAVEVTFDNRAPAEMKRLSYERALSLYRVLQELFANTVKHAGAGKVSLTFYQEGNELVCVYKDNGRGLGKKTPGQPSWGIGMRNIESRLGMIRATYQLQDPSEQGFGIQINIPD
ncbi:sensor histidine kinase [Dinghuibacter silviterrae]|uniref:sensor histidine kinase n=1 Tax=Dinghuibacter silviterrae TaxID=1539049 RepID=UPI0013C34390|nr:histidine kinase [Dinghuibacter silviterrae]